MTVVFKISVMFILMAFFSNCSMFDNQGVDDESEENQITIQGRAIFTDSTGASNISVAILGSHIKTITDSLGYYEFRLALDSINALNKDTLRLLVFDGKVNVGTQQYVLEGDTIIPDLIIDYSSGIMIDDRTKAEYNWTRIGDQIWISQGLNTHSIRLYTGSIVTENDLDNMCPVGWHIPSFEEFTILENFARSLHADKSIKELFVDMGDGRSLTGFNAESVKEEYSDKYSSSYWAVERCDGKVQLEKDALPIGSVTFADSTMAHELLTPPHYMIGIMDYTKAVGCVLNVASFAHAHCNDVDVTGPKTPICKADSSKCGSFTDERNRYEYGWVMIGGQKWMQDNLHFGVADDSWCSANFNDATMDCMYGSYYYKPTINVDTVCPSGWRVPSTYEWYRLVEIIEQDFYGSNLKDTVETFKRTTYLLNDSLYDLNLISCFVEKGDGYGGQSGYNIDPSHGCLSGSGRFLSSTLYGQKSILLWIDYNDFQSGFIKNSENLSSIRCIQ